MAKVLKNVTIYRESGRFAGWPANYGIWSWENEIVVGFTVGSIDPAGGFHARDTSKPFLPMQARSLDGGDTWLTASTPCETPGGRGLSADEHMMPQLQVGKSLTDQDVLPWCSGGIDFSHPDFALMCSRSGLADGAISWFYVSNNRCKSWQGPYRLPSFGKTGVAARTDYLVNGSNSCSLFLTAAKASGDQGRVFYVETTNGGKSFELISNVGPEPSGYAIMPASVRLSPDRILVALRCRVPSENFETTRHYIDLFVSNNNGKDWEFLSQPVPVTGKGGNPPTLTKLLDGRLCIVYGYRNNPFGIRARISSDEGVSWGEEIILRQDGANHDIGYPRTVQRPDGVIVTAYYYNDKADGERYIAATLWQPE